MAGPSVLNAYFDESERSSGIFCVAGYVYTKPSEEDFDKKWRSLLGERLPFHMADLIGGRKQFKGLSQDERDELLKQAVAIINSTAMIGVACSCSLRDFEDIAPKQWAAQLSHAYTVCAHFAMGLVSKWLKDAADDRLVAYHLEAGHRHMSRADALFSQVPRFNLFRALYQYSSHRFVEKSSAAALQSADLLAWEFAKYYDETHINRTRMMRKSLLALARGRLNNYKFLMLNREQIERFYREWRFEADRVTEAEAKRDLDRSGFD